VLLIDFIGDLMSGDAKICKRNASATPLLKEREKKLIEYRTMCKIGEQTNNNRKVPQINDSFSKINKKKCFITEIVILN
jgi:hypothetical protein